MTTMYPKRCTSVLLLLGLLAAAPLRAAGAEEEGCPPPRTLKKCGELGERYFQSGQYDLAIQAFRQAYVIKPIPLFLYNIAQALRLSGQSEEAARSFDRYLEADPSTKLRAEVEGYLAVIRHNRVERTEPTKPSPEVEGPRKQQEEQQQAAAARKQQEEQQQAAALREQQQQEPARIAPQPRPDLLAIPGPSPTRRKKWWFWTVLSVVVVGGATAGIVAATYHPASPFPMGIEVHSAN